MQAGPVNGANERTLRAGPVTQQTFKAWAISRRDIGFAFEREAIAVSGEAALSGRSCREIVEDAGLASDGVSKSKLCKVTCIITVVVGCKSCKVTVVGAMVDVCGDATTDVTDDAVDIFIRWRWQIDGDKCAVARDPDSIGDYGMEMDVPNVERPSERCLPPVSTSRRPSESVRPARLRG